MAIELTERRCNRGRAHPAHNFVPNPKSIVEYACPGQPAVGTLADLLDRRPELRDVALGAQMHVLGVMPA